MKVARLAVLGVAIVAGLGAAMLASSSSPPTPATVEVAAPVPQIETDDVLVASADLPLGKIISDSDLTWQAWPKAALSSAMIRKSDAPNVLEDLRGAFVRMQISQGDPIRREKLIKSGATSGFLSAILPAGSRAVAINIDTQGATTAGGFILPNDRVDVLRTGRDEDVKGGDGFVTETVLTNIRVLAIGQNVQEKNGEKVVVGSNATLEVDPRQAELLVLAQRVGQLSLTLRSMADIVKPANETVVPDVPERGPSVIRFGVAQGGR